MCITNNHGQTILYFVSKIFIKNNKKRFTWTKTQVHDIFHEKKRKTLECSSVTFLLNRNFTILNNTVITFNVTEKVLNYLEFTCNGSYGNMLIHIANSFGSVNLTLPEVIQMPNEKSDHPTWLIPLLVGIICVLCVIIVIIYFVTKK